MLKNNLSSSILIFEKDNPTDFWYNTEFIFSREKDLKIEHYLDHLAGKFEYTVITSCNDGALFRWRTNINRTDGFYFKDIYSLTDIFKSKE